MSDGKVFETEFKNSFNGTGHFFIRLKDAPKWLRGGGVSFQTENIADSVAFTMPFMWVLELKSTKGTSISFNAGRPDEKPSNARTNVMIKANQVRELKKAANYNGVIPGFIFNYRETDKRKNSCYFVNILDFLAFAENSGKASINQADCKKIGVLIESVKRKVSHKYDIQDFVDRSIIKFLLNGYLNRETLQKLFEWLRLVLGQAEDYKLGGDIKLAET